MTNKTSADEIELILLTEPIIDKYKHEILNIPDLANEIAQLYARKYKKLFLELVNKSYPIFLTNEDIAKGKLGGDVSRHWDMLRQELRQAIKDITP